MVVLILLVLTTGNIALGADKLIVHHRPPDGSLDRRHEYFRQLLILALEKTRADFGNFEVKAAGVPISQARAFNMLKQGKLVDVVWTMTTDEREKQALPVRVPLLNGLIACRVLLINESDVERFAALENLKDLRDLVAVQGADWPDTAVLTANDMPVVSASDYDGMFRMLAARRVDYFPRSVMEVGVELDTYRDLHLTIAPGLALKYTAPIYFFVSPDNHELHRRLSAGLERAVADGSFQALFESQPGHDNAQRILASTQRVFELRNPLLTIASESRTPCGTH